MGEEVETFAFQAEINQLMPLSPDRASSPSLLVVAQVPRTGWGWRPMPCSGIPRLLQLLRHLPLQTLKLVAQRRGLRAR